MPQSFKRTSHQPRIAPSDGRHDRIGSRSLAFRWVMLSQHHLSPIQAPMKNPSRQGELRCRTNTAPAAQRNLERRASFPCSLSHEPNPRLRVKDSCTCVSPLAPGIGCAIQSELPKCRSLRRLHVIQDFLLRRSIAGPSHSSRRVAHHAP